MAGVGLALVAGALASYGFAPLAWRPALWLGLTLLFCLVYAATPARAARFGAAFGLSYFGLGVYWLYHSLYVYGGTPLWLASLVVAVLVCYLSLYCALATMLSARFASLGAYRMILLAVLLALGEWLRGKLMTGFPWVLVGQGSLDSPWAGYLPLVGIHGTSLLLLLSVACVAIVLRQSHGRRAALGGVLLIVVAGESARHVQWSEPLGKPLPVVAVQANLNPAMRWRANGIETIQNLYKRLTESVADMPLVIWPEGAIPLYYQNTKGFFTKILEDVLAKDATLVSGVFYRDDAGSHTGVMNVTTEEVVGKRHLVPMGEFMPLADLLQPVYRMTNIQMRSLTPAYQKPLLDIQGYSIGVTTCYESAYPSRTREAMPEAVYLLNLTDDGWFGNTRGPWQHLEVARVRTVEHAREMIRATTTGISAIINAKGTIVYQAPQSETAFLKGTVQPHTGLTPYSRFGEWPFVLLVVALLCAGVFGRRQPAQ